MKQALIAYIISTGYAGPSSIQSFVTLGFSCGFLPNRPGVAQDSGGVRGSEGPIDLEQRTLGLWVGVVVRVTVAVGVGFIRIRA